MQVRYIYSACVVVETPDAKILCDPWFTPGAYDGSWYQYPVLPDPVAAIGPVDLIYVSHIHPDHYDPAFLHRYLARYPAARLAIGPQQPPYLATKMRIDGFKPEIAERLSLGATELLIVPNEDEAGPRSEIDSALAIRRHGMSVLNLNDNPFVERQVERLLAFCPGGKPDFALLPYSGAGPYPQTFEFASPEELAAAVARKRRQFLDGFTRYLRRLDPKKAMPFAGKYYLGGPLAALNRLRGVPDAVDVADEHGERVVVLADGGTATYDLVTGRASAVRTEPYDQDLIDAHLRSLAVASYDYERELQLDADRVLPMLPLLASAKKRARGKVRIEEPYWLILKPRSNGHAFLLNLGDDSAPSVEHRKDGFDALSPRLEIDIDDRYLFGLLTRLYHWNNAEVGSQYRSRRVPDRYRPDVYRFLNMFQV